PRVRTRRANSPTKFISQKSNNRARTKEMRIRRRILFGSTLQSRKVGFAQRRIEDSRHADGKQSRKVGLEILRGAERSGLKMIVHVRESGNYKLTRGVDPRGALWNRSLVRGAGLHNARPINDNDRIRNGFPTGDIN